MEPPKTKWKLYALSCVVFCTNQLIHKPYVIAATDEGSAKEVVLQKLRKEFPVANGYWGHAVGILEVPQHVLEGM